MKIYFTHMLLYYINSYLLYLQVARSCPTSSAKKKKQKKLVEPWNHCLIWPKLPKVYTNSPSLPTRTCVIKKKTEIKSSRTSKIKPTNTALIGQRDLVLNQRYIIRCRNLVLLCEEGNARFKRLAKERERRQMRTKSNESRWRSERVLPKASTLPPLYRLHCFLHFTPQGKLMSGRRVEMHLSPQRWTVGISDQEGLVN